MSIYPCACRTCDARFESRERPSPPIPACPECGSLDTRYDWKRARVNTMYHPTKGAKP